MKSKLSACLIVKNEEDTISSCLESVRSHVDEIVVVDTGSTDKTLETVKKYTDRIFEFVWQNDFSAARNFSLDCTANDWVLVLDADEAVVQWNTETVDCFIAENSCGKPGNSRAAGNIERVSTFVDDGVEKKYIDRVNRLFNKQYFRFEGSIHEQLAALNGAFDRVDVDIKLTHSGYTDNVIKRKDKTERNISMLKQAIKEKGDDCYLIYQLGKSYEMAKNNEDARRYFEKAIKLVPDFNLIYVRDLVISYGYALYRTGDIKDALLIEKYRDYYVNSPDYNFLLAYLYMMNGMFTKAAQTFLFCTTLKNGQMEGVTSWLPLYNTGVIFECLGKRDEALLYYSQCGNYQKALERIKVISKKS